jgi:hypothetical protein
MVLPFLPRFHPQSPAAGWSRESIEEKPRLLTQPTESPGPLFAIFDLYRFMEFDYPTILFRRCSCMTNLAVFIVLVNLPLQAGSLKLQRLSAVDLAIRRAAGHPNCRPDC